MPKSPNPQTLADAAHYGDEVGVLELLDSGADPNAVGDDGRSPLIEAVTNSRWETRLAIVQALLAAGADPDGRDAQSRTAFAHSVISGSVEIALALSAESPDVNALDDVGLTPLAYAAACGHAWMVDWLIGSQAAHDLRRAFPPQLAAAASGHGRIVRKLLEQGVEMTTRLGPL